MYQNVSNLKIKLSAFFCTANYKRIRGLVLIEAYNSPVCNLTNHRKV